MGKNTLLSYLHCQSDKNDAFMAYQKWLRKIFPLLIFGNASVWGEYRKCKGYLLKQFPQLHSQMTPGIEDFLSQIPNRETICDALRIDPAFLLRLEHDDQLQPPRGIPPLYSYEDQKRIYWALFFQREMGIDQDGLEALLCFLNCVSRNADVPTTEPRSPEGEGSKNNEAEIDAPTEVKRAIIREMLHDIGTPLHIIGGRASLLKRKLANSEIAEKNLSIIQDQVEKIIALLQKYVHEAESCGSETNMKIVTTE